MYSAYLWNISTLIPGIPVLAIMVGRAGMPHPPPRRLHSPFHIWQFCVTDCLALHVPDCRRFATIC